jgi:hypothetical protein
VIHFLSGIEVELVKRNVAVVLVADVESGGCQNIVVNLLGRPPVPEDESDRIFLGQRWRRVGRLGDGRVGWGGGLGLIGWRIVIAGGVVLGGLRIVVGRCVGVSQVARI